MINRRTTLKALILGLAFFGASLSQTIAQAQEVTTLRIGYQKSASVLAFAKEKKLFEKNLAPLNVQSIQWVEFQYGPPLLEALSAGAINIGNVGDTPPIFAQSAGANIEYFAATPVQESAILVAENSTITKVEDLKGKKVAVAKGSSAHNLTIRALEKYGLKFSDIEPVYLSPSDALAALATKRVDAWTVWDPYASLAQKNQKARKILSSFEGGLDSYSFYIVNRDFAKNNPKITEAIYKTLQEATELSGQNREELAKLVSQLTGVDEDVQRSVIANTPFKILAIDNTIIASQQKTADTLFDLKLIANPVKVSDIIWRMPSAQ